MSVATSSNLLLTLHRWASRQDENFITDAFTHLLQRLILEDTRAGLGLIEKLIGKRLPIECDPASIHVSTQVTLAKGRPDLVIGWPQHLVYVEAKVESGLGNRQLERYLEELDTKVPPERSTLVVLSRYPVDVDQGIVDRVVARRWYQVAHWLIESLEQNLVTDNINKFLVDQLVGFFKARNITMERVEPEIVAGVRSFKSLVAMVTEAISARRTTMAPSFGRDWAGWYFDKKVQDFFYGVYYERPNVVVFETTMCPVPSDADKRLGVGRMSADSTTPNKRKWCNDLVLDSEEVKFFVLSREEQMRRIETFLAECIDAANRIREVQQHGN